jgi:predicted enzyme related to lactoylglutathione lyase
MFVAATLPVSDMERATSWYAAMFDLQPVRTTETEDVWYELGGAQFMLYRSRFAGTNQATAATFGVEDVEATVADLRRRGASFEEYDFGEEFRTVDGVMTTPDGTKFAWLKDPEGNILGIGPATMFG